VRQRVLVVLALLMAALGAVVLVTRLGRGSEELKVHVSTTDILYDYEQHTILTSAEDPESRHHVIGGQVILRGRELHGTRTYRSAILGVGFEERINGVPSEKPPQMQLATPMDRRARPLIDGRPDLYWLDLLNTPEFFPFLTGGPTSVGQCWEDQFRVVLPQSREQMIVSLRTCFEGYERVGLERLARITYALEGETLYKRRDSGLAEKAVLRLEGHCLWDARMGFPHSIKHEMRLRTLDYDRIRKAEEAISDERLATKSLRVTRVKLDLKRKGAPRKTPRATPRQARADRYDDF
jgi:hypothetical protein